MMRDQDDITLTPEAERARDAVRALERVRPDPAFRARLKEAFVSGEFAGRERARPSVRSAARPWWRQPLTWIAAPAATAVALVIAFVLNAGPAWQVSTSGEAAAWTVDGAPVVSHDPEALTRRMHPGARVTVPEGAELSLSSRGQLLLLATSGTEFEVPRVPGRWFGREVRGRIARGVMRVTTAEGFRGAVLEVATPDADVRITGTTLAIICEPAGTCVCVLEGEVRVGAQGEAPVPVVGGTRRFVFNDGRAPEADEMRPMERMKLGDFREQAGRLER